MTDDSKDPKNNTEPLPPHDDAQIIDDVAADLVDLQAAVRGVDAGLEEVIKLLKRQAADARARVPAVSG